MKVRKLGPGSLKLSLRLLPHYGVTGVSTSAVYATK
jgi:hypothetical protein